MRRNVDAATKANLSPANIDRLRLIPARVRAAADGLRQVAALPDPVAVCWTPASGQRLAGPQGQRAARVIFFIYESRPNVTIDAAGLCVKSGNAIILRGGKEALASNTILPRSFKIRSRQSNCRPMRCSS